VFTQTVDLTTLLADYGFAPRTAFVSELSERLRRKILPGTPETTDASDLFRMVLPGVFDAAGSRCSTKPSSPASARCWPMRRWTPTARRAGATR
jgi:hypothetical protein